MKHIFIMNPAAGNGRAGKVFLPRIIETSKRLGIDYEIHRTIAPKDAEHFVKARCEAREKEMTKEAIRFYACGGDGTLNEVANGAYGYSNIEIAMIPAGTGNDFPRNFGNTASFEDIEAQILGSATSIDLIRYQTKADGDETPAENGVETSKVRYSVNMFNIGLDCNAADLAGKAKQYPLVSGTLAYIMGVAVVLGKKEGVTLKLTFDDGDVYEGDFMLTAIGNGSYCGGGFKGLPRAKTDDGLIDAIVVNDMTRRTFLKLIGKYHKGTHLDEPGISKYVTYKRCRKLKIVPNGMVKMAVDGEISTVGEVEFEIVPNAMKFSVPRLAIDRENML